MGWIWTRMDSLLPKDALLIYLTGKQHFIPSHVILTTTARLCGIPLTRGSLRPRYSASLVMAYCTHNTCQEPTPSGGTREANPTIMSLGTDR